MKTATLQDYLARYNLDTLIETGLDRGRGSGMGVQVGRYIALDYRQENVDAAIARGFDARCGDSGELMADLLTEIDGPALFWLDAHGIDCHEQQEISVAAFPGWDKIPLLQELSAIDKWEHGAASVVFVDDMPAMAQWVGVGKSALVSAEPFYAFLRALNCRWEQELAAGILRLTPPTC